MNIRYSILADLVANQSRAAMKRDLMPSLKRDRVNWRSKLVAEVESAASPMNFEKLLHLIRPLVSKQGVSSR